MQPIDITEGEGLADIWKAIKSTFRDVFGPLRQKLPPLTRDVMAVEGNKPIALIKVARSPIIPAITKVMNILSLGRLQQQQRALGYDRLYHLYMTVQLADNTVLLVEKNEVIIVRGANANDFKRPGVEWRDVPLPGSLTLNQMFASAQQAVGDQRFIQYDVSSTNCQVFIFDLLKNSGLLTPELYNFIVQDAGQLLSTAPWLSRFAKSVTDFAGKIDLLIHGQGLQSF